MAPINSRQLLAWTLPTIAALLSYLWYKRKRIGAVSDPGDKELSSKADARIELDSDTTKSTSVPRDIVDKVELISKSNVQSPVKSFGRSLSGIESTPIDIVIPKELRSVKTVPVIISDEDLDFEIEKVKSMKNSNPIEIFNKARTANSSPKISSNEIVKVVDKLSEVKTFSENTIIMSNDMNSKENIKNSAEPLKTSPMAEKNIKIQQVPFECKKTPPTKISSGVTKSKKQKNKNKSNNAQKDMAVVEEKLNTLKLNCNVDKVNDRKREGEKKKKPKSRSSSGCEREELQRQSSERDSANHSPADVMLASPSLSSISDAHSEGSNDSGKGGSDVATPPPSRVPGTDGSVSFDAKVVYEFVVPQGLVGKLIGKRGVFVHQINYKTNATILVSDHPTDINLQVCRVEGTQSEIERALKMIRDRFPLKKFPEITLDQVSFAPVVTPVPLLSDHLYLKLIAEINNDTIMSCMVTPNHLFLQQPTHPTFPNLNILRNYMNICYSSTESPCLPSPIPEYTVCAAYSVDSWCRAMILSTNLETETSYVKFLDYGGYAYVENSALRQIRADFMLLPFQAAECFLANVKPIGDCWHEDAYSLVANLTKGLIIFTQVVDYTDDDVPLVHCYSVMGPQLVFINQELVNRGFAEWVSYDEEPEEQEGAVGVTLPREIVQES